MCLKWVHNLIKASEFSKILSPYAASQARLAAMKERLSTVALIVAAGRGSRAGQGKPKQYRDMPDGSGGSVLARSIAAFADNEVISSLCVAIHKDDVKLYENIINNCNKKDKSNLCFRW